MIALAVALALAAPGGHAWQFVGAAGELALFVDDASVVRNEPGRRAWVVGVPGAANEIAVQAPGAYTMAAHEVDCARRTDAISKLYVYGPGGDTLAEQSNVYPVTPVAPYSAGELVVGYVCDGTITTDKVAKITSLEKVKEFGVEWLRLLDGLEAAGRARKP